MNYIVLDMEWNQACCKELFITDPFPLNGEIIQIGAVKLDENFREIDNFKILISPVYYRKMNSMVKRLTSIKNADLKQGYHFTEAVRYFRDWCGEDFVIMAWGPEDEVMLRDNLALFNMSTDWLPAWYDLQCIFNDQYVRRNKQISLSSAISQVGVIPLTAHDALNDAINTVAVCRHLDIAKGIAEYEEISHKDYSAEVEEPIATICLNKLYPTRAKALEAPELMVVDECPECGGTVSCRGHQKQNKDKVIALGVGENGEEYFVRFKLIKTDEGIKVNTIIYNMDNYHSDYYNSICHKNNAEDIRTQECGAVSL